MVKMNGQKHLLVIRLSAMGDVAMTIPVISALVQQNPEVRVTVITREFFKPMFTQVPNVNVFAVDVKGKHKGIYGLWRLYKELKVLNLDGVADLHNVLRSNILKIYFNLGGYKFRQIDKGRAEKKALTSQNNKVFEPLKSTHQRYADVFSELGYAIDLDKVSLLKKRELPLEAKTLVLEEDVIIIGIAPFAAFKGKMYPIDLMEQVVSELNSDERYQVILFGGGNKEQQQLEKWESQFKNVTSAVGKLSFNEELALISNLDLMVAMDSGNAHLAALFGIPVVTIWGVTHPFAGFYPFGQDAENALRADREKYPLIPTSIYGNKMPEGYDSAMRTIHPTEIIEKIHLVLQKSRR